MKSRLFLVCGLAEVWTCAALRSRLDAGGDDVLVVYGLPVSVSEQLRRDTLEMARAFYPWTKVLDAVDLTPAFATLQGDVIAGAAATLRERIGRDSFDEIFTHTIFKPGEQGILQSYPGARIILFDNGTSSHLDRTRYSGPPDPKRSLQVPEVLLARVETAFFSLLGIFPTPNYLESVPCRDIDRDWLLGAARSAFEKAPDAFATVKAPSPVLVLGKAFYRTSRITYEDEKAIYVSLLKKLRERGASSVIYKEHPRANKAPLLGAADGVTVLESRMPVEIWPLATKFEAAYSIISTALLTMRKLYDLPGYAIGRELPISQTMDNVRLGHAHMPPPPWEQ